MRPQETKRENKNCSLQKQLPQRMLWPSNPLPLQPLPLQGTLRAFRTREAGDSRSLLCLMVTAISRKHRHKRTGSGANCLGSSPGWASWVILGKLLDHPGPQHDLSHSQLLVLFLVTV